MEYEGNSCFDRFDGYDASIQIDKSDSMAGSNSAWYTCFSSNDFVSQCHMDGAVIGDYLSMEFLEEMKFNGFRFECGGNNDGRNIEQNVFNIQYFDDASDSWITVGTTDTANGNCEPAGTPGYSEWDAQYSSTKWRFILTEHHGGPWYHGFAWYMASGKARNLFFLCFSLIAILNFELFCFDVCFLFRSVP